MLHHSLIITARSHSLKAGFRPILPLAKNYPMDPFIFLSEADPRQAGPSVTVTVALSPCHSTEARTAARASPRPSPEVRAWSWTGLQHSPQNGPDQEISRRLLELSSQRHLCILAHQSSLHSTGVSYCGSRSRRLTATSLRRESAWGSGRSP